MEVHQNEVTGYRWPYHSMPRVRRGEEFLWMRGAEKCFSGRQAWQDQSIVSYLISLTIFLNCNLWIGHQVVDKKVIKSARILFSPLLYSTRELYPQSIFNELLTSWRQRNWFHFIRFFFFFCFVYTFYTVNYSPKSKLTCIVFFKRLSTFTALL